MTPHGPGGGRPLTSRACPSDVRARQRTGTGVGLLLALVLAAVLLTALPDDDHGRDAAACAPLTVALLVGGRRVSPPSSPATATTRPVPTTGPAATAHTRCGCRTGGCCGCSRTPTSARCTARPTRSGESYAWRDATAPLVRNSAVLMDDGRLAATLPAPLFPDPAPEPVALAGRGPCRAPLAGLLGAGLRVLLWVRTAGQSPWIYGVPTATEVATLSLPGLRVESVVEVLDQRTVQDPSRRVLFGTTLVEEGGWTYVFGGDDGQAASRPVSQAYVARVPAGGLGDPRGLGVLGRLRVGGAGPAGRRAGGRPAHRRGQRVLGGAAGRDVRAVHDGRGGAGPDHGDLVLGLLPHRALARPGEGLQRRRCRRAWSPPTTRRSTPNSAVTDGWC